MSQSETDIIRDIRSDYGYGWHVDDLSTIYKAPKGLTHELLDVISDHKSEPDWMRAFRHQSLDYFLARLLRGVRRVQVDQREPAGELTGQDREVRPDRLQVQGTAERPGGRHFAPAFRNRS